MNLARDWWLPGLTWRSAPLLPLAWLFGRAGAARRAAYRAGWRVEHRLPVPVVVVGNLTVGGSGKTPLVIHLATELARLGRRPGVISRGFGGRARAVVEVGPHSEAGETGDEPLLIRRRAGCPVFVGAQRVDAARALLAAYPATDLIIADDGLQHLRLARDYQIAVFDERGAGNGHLLPAGPLREPLARAAMMDALVANGAGASEAIAAATGGNVGRQLFAMRLVPGDLYRLASPALTCPSAQFAARHAASVAAVAGIGNPGRFFATLRALGLTVLPHPFPDHHAFSRDELARIDAQHIVMTEKDALKCAGFDDPRIWVAPVTADVDAGLTLSILEKLRGYKAA